MSTTVNCPNCSTNINTCAGEGCCNNSCNWSRVKEDNSVSPITEQPKSSWTNTENTEKKDETTPTEQGYACWGSWDNAPNV